MEKEMERGAKMSREYDLFIKQLDDYLSGYDQECTKCEDGFLQCVSEEQLFDYIGDHYSITRNDFRIIEEAFSSYDDVYHNLIAKNDLYDYFYSEYDLKREDIEDMFSVYNAWEERREIPCECSE